MPDSLPIWDLTDLYSHDGDDIQRDLEQAATQTDKLAQYAKSAAQRGLEVIIAGAGGAAHLPGMVAANTWLPVLGVPVESKALKGMDSLLSIAQMPGGVPVGTLAIGEAGAKNAGLLAAGILATNDSDIKDALIKFRDDQTKTVLSQNLDC